MNASKTQRGIVSTGLGFVTGGVFELAFGLGLTIAIGIGIVLTLLGVFVPLPSGIDAGIERQLHFIKKGWILFFIFLAAGVVAALLILAPLHTSQLGELEKENSQLLAEKEQREIDIVDLEAQVLSLQGQINERKEPGIGEVGGPADFVKWDKRDPLTINKIAYLWYGCEPAASNRFGKFWTGDIQQIHDEINTRFHVEKAFEGQYTTEVGDGSGHQNNWIPRAALIKWANERGEKPAFLFPEERSKE